MSNKTILGFLVLVVLASSYYIFMPENVKILVSESSSTFSVWEPTTLKPNGSWVTSGIESNKLFNGTKLLTATSRTVINSTVGNLTNLTRIVLFNKASVTDNYHFDGSITDKELFPVSETHEVINAKGLIYQYQVTKLIYIEGNKDILGLNQYSFGRNMKIKWEGKPYFAKITQQINGYGTLTLKYIIASNDERYNIRLFDPWYNASWYSTRPLSNTSVIPIELTDYQFKFNITRGSCNADFSDLRITQENGTYNNVSVPYWIESNLTGNWAQGYFKGNSTTGNIQAYAWCGNPTATSQSNGNTTFIRYAGIENNNLLEFDAKSAGSGINTTSAYTGTKSLLIVNNATADTVSINLPYPRTAVIEAHFYDSMMSVSATTLRNRIFVNTNSTSGTAYFGVIGGVGGGNTNYTITYYDGAWHDLSSGLPRSLGWRDFKFVMNGTHMKIYVDNVASSVAPLSWGYTTGLNISSELNNGGFSANWDDIIIRNYMSPEPTLSIGAEQTQATTITTYLNGTNINRFYELGDPINITACANVTGTTVFINTTHPSFTNQIANGTTCATYLWNNSNVIINQFNDSSTTQNHSANNISGVTINSVTDLQGGSEYLRGSPFGNSIFNITIDNSINTNDTSGDVFWQDFIKGNDSDITTYAYQIALPGLCEYSDLYENYTWNNEYASSNRVLYQARVYASIGFGTIAVISVWNYSSGDWYIMTPYSQPADGSIMTYERVIPNSTLSVGKPIYIRVSPGSCANDWQVNFYNGKIIYENITVNSQYPYNISIAIGNDTQNYWLPYMTLQDTYAIMNRFKTNSLTKELIFSRGGTNVTYVQAPCNSQANSLSFNVSGGSGTQNLNKVDGLSSKSLVFSTENSSNTFNLYLPKSSTVATAPVNITLTGSPYYSSSTSLSGGSQTMKGTTGYIDSYIKTQSKVYDGTNIVLWGEFYFGRYCAPFTAYLYLVGDSGTKASCSHTFTSGCYENYWISCSVSVSVKQPSEKVWVRAYSPDGWGAAESFEQAGNATTYFSGLNQYDVNNATNVTIWQNGTNLNYQYLQELNSSNPKNVTLSNTNMNSYLSTCTQDSCPVPYTVKTTKRGNVTISGVNVDYTNSISNITYDVANDGVIDASISGASIPNNNVTIGANGLNTITNYAQTHCINNSVSVPIVATSATAGTMSLSNLVGNFSINPVSLNMGAMNNYLKNIRPNSQTMGSENITDKNKGDMTTYSVVQRGTTFNYTYKTRPSKIYYSFSESVNDGGRVFYVEIYNYSSLTWDILYSLNGDIPLTYFSNDTSSNNYWNGDTTQIRMRVPGGLGSGYTWANVYDMYIDLKTENIQVPIKYTADNWGILNTYGLALNALTDYNYTFTGWSDAVTNATQTVKLIWSNFSIKYPTGTSFFVFQPKTVNSTGVSPDGQTNSIPFYNISYLSREQPMDIYMKLGNASITGLNFTVSNSSNFTNSFLLNTTYQRIYSNFTSGTIGNWFNENLFNVNSSLYRYWNVNVQTMSKCSQCV